MQRFPAAIALSNARKNEFKHWNLAPSSSERSRYAIDASARIYDGIADIRASYDGPRLSLEDPVFAMGSCFAREIEHGLKQKGGNVVSIDNTIQRPEFLDASGHVRDGIFHRFTPFAMRQEFQQCFDELPSWSDQALLIPTKGDRWIDCNYWGISGMDDRLETILTRRRIARDLVRHAVEAKIVILTLGLTECWRHIESALWANYTSPKLLARNADAFELCLMTAAEAIQCLEDIRDLILRHTRQPDLQFVVTVSPVPLQATFTDKDIVIANMDSKAALRTAAGEFTSRHADAHYFPSYEIVTYTNPELAWRPDRIHVEPAVVAHIVRTFTEAFYSEDANHEDALSRSILKRGTII